VAPVGPAAVPTTDPASMSPRRSPKNYILAAGLVVMVCAVLAPMIVLRRPTVNIAVARFDNETDSAEMDRFADGLTDAVVAELTAADGARFGIIGNAAILRRPRGQRVLMAIGSSLPHRRRPPRPLSKNPTTDIFQAAYNGNIKLAAN
jgi:hypothetical protein